MRTGWVPLGALIFWGLLIVGCGGGDEITSVPVVERPSGDTSETVDTTRAERTASVVPIPAPYDTVRPQRFDRGRMWTFRNFPTEYFQDTYGFAPDQKWRTKAKRGALEFGDKCSASFVSADGLVMTNHHCAREFVSAVSRSGESLLEDGFYASSPDAERKVEDFHVDQLVEVEDVTAKVYDGLRQGRQAEAQARQQRVESLEKKMTADAARRDSSRKVRIQPVYQGAKYSAYTYRRYQDVRLVMAPELRLGYFGGAADNFSYPRYVLDVAFFRVYTDEGKPLQPTHYFSWDTDGAQAGEAVFAVGHPASTSRLRMVSQLKYERDHQLPNRLEVLRKRSGLIADYINSHPDSAAHYDLRNPFFTIKNTIESLRGQLRGLQDPYLRARRGKAVRTLRDSILAVDSLQQKYGQIIGEIQQLQQSKTVIADKRGAFVTFANLNLGSRILVRALHGYYHDFLQKRGAPPSRLRSIRQDAKRIDNWPPGLEKAFLVAQFKEIRETYGAGHPTMQRLFKSRSPTQLADRLVQKSALMDSTSFMTLFNEGYLASDDPSVSVIEALAPMFLNVNRQMQDIRNTEQTLSARLSRARFSIYESAFPPNANGSLRISDGRVRSYPYNGTMAPPFTNFYGLYDQYFSHGGSAWSLPAPWVNATDSLDLGTPLNLVSTNDISGGSSGSPLLNQDLEVVGVVFDSNTEGLPNEYLYRTQAARAISVDARGILEALRAVYDADRLVQEIRTGEHPLAGTAGAKE